MPRAETLRSRANPLYKRLRALKERSDRELCLLEGPRLVLEALEAGVGLVEAAASERAGVSPAGRAALAALRREGVPVRAMSAELVSSLSETETSQGLLALARRPSFAEEGIFRGIPLVLVADGIQNPGNLGGLLRSAEAAGASGAILAGGCADPFSWKALRGSMGSAFRLPHLRGVSMEHALDVLQARKIAVFATAAGERRFDEADLRGAAAILVGTEGAGLPSAVLERADPFSWKALRGSMGSAFRLPHLRGVSMEHALDVLQARKIAVFATAAAGERRFDEADLRGAAAILVGTEGAGLPSAVLERADARLRIPLREPVESVNVGVAAALVLFEAARQRGFPRARTGE